LPPFLLLNGDFDYAALRAMTKKFAEALRKNGCDVQTREIEWRTHETVLFDIVHLDSDATTRSAILNFIERLEKRTVPGRDEERKRPAERR
jgi:hypothetical protein